MRSRVRIPSSPPASRCLDSRLARSFAEFTLSAANGLRISPAGSNARPAAQVRIPSSRHILLIVHGVHLQRLSPKLDICAACSESLGEIGRKNSRFGLSDSQGEAQLPFSEAARATQRGEAGLKPCAPSRMYCILGLGREINNGNAGQHSGEAYEGKRTSLVLPWDCCWAQGEENCVTNILKPGW